MLHDEEKRTTHLEAASGGSGGGGAHAARGALRLRLSPVWRDVVLRRLLLLADVGACAIAAWSLEIGRAHGDVYTLWALAAAPAWFVLAKLLGLYDADHRSLRHLTADELPALAGWALTCAAATTLVLFASAHDPSGYLSLRLWMVQLGAAFVFRAVARWAWRRYTPPARTLLVGSEQRVRAVARKLELFPDIHVEVVGRIERIDEAALDRADLLQGVDRIIVVGDAVDEGSLQRLLVACRSAYVKVSLIPALHGMFGTAAKLTRVADLPFVEYTTWDVSRSTLALKRAFDIAVAAAGLIVLVPLFAATALAVLLADGRPVFFTQKRASQHGKPFRLIKFRSMVLDAEELLPDVLALHTLDGRASKLANDPRVTRFGRLLRHLSLDELPQLWNVLVGEMSLVGPRPEQVDLVARYSPEDRFRLAVKPGLTGPMQVHGRGHLTFEERLSVEREYIENLSLQRDVRLLAMTIAAIATGKGAF